MNWYNAHKRDLPFRRTKDPYKIWLSEIMLQQTTMKVVLDYYKRFTKKFPTVASAAKPNEGGNFTSTHIPKLPPTKLITPKHP